MRVRRTARGLIPLVKVEMAHISDHNVNQLTVVCMNGHVMERPRKWRRVGFYVPWNKQMTSEEDAHPRKVRCQQCAEVSARRSR